MLRGGLIGCGFFAANQLHAWRDIDGARIVALCDSDPDRLAQAGDRFGIAARHADAAALLARGDLDFVDIATTVASHRPLVEAAADAGVHVICQKPLAPTMEDARAMVAAVEARGRTFMVHENFRWQSAIRAVIETVRSGAIGTPFFCRASFRSGYDVYTGQPYLATDARFIVQDLGIHVLDIVRAVMGDAVRIAANIQRINPSIVGEDVATMLLTHESGASSVVDCSYATRRRPETFPETLLEIDGHTGSLRLEAGYRLTVQTPEGSETLDVTPPLHDWAERPWFNIQDSVLAIQRHFVDCIRDGRIPETSGRDNLGTLALVEGAYISASEGRTVATTEP